MAKIIPDRRTARSRRAITSAFVALVLERRYDAIRVGDIVEKADVGRSTFYEHFRSKDDLLRQSMEGLLARIAGSHVRSWRPRLAPRCAASLRA
jgi:AcrR family transcriptional regulator